MASSSTSTPTRPLVLHSSAARVSILVPASPLSAWVASEVLAQDFHDSRVGLDDEPLPVVADEEEGAIKAPASNEPQVKLLARFLAFVSDRASLAASPELSQVLLAAYKRFNELFLPVLCVQSLVQSFDPEARAEILTAYFKAFDVLRRLVGSDDVSIAHPSALLEAAKTGDAELYAVFGGQGHNEVSPKLQLSRLRG